MNRRTLLSALAAFPAAILLAGCGEEMASSGISSKGLKEIKLSTLSGPHAEVAEVAVAEAAKLGLKVRIVEFSDYGHVNEALYVKDIDVNAFQHVPFLKKAMNAKGYDFTPLGKTVLFPLGVYSQKVKSVSEIKDGMLVTLPSDPANLGRALVLLEKHGIIKLRDGAGVGANPRDVVENPLHLEFKEVDSALLGRSLPDVGFS